MVVGRAKRKERRPFPYVNGVEKSRNPAKGPRIPNPNQNFKIGQGYHSGRYFHGLLSDVRIYREALSVAEVADLAKQGK